MRVLHSGSLDVRSGGPALSMSLTMKGLEHTGVKCVGLSEEVSPGSRLYDPSQPIRLTHRGRFGTLSYVDNIYDCLEREDGVDLYHIHGIWMYHGWAVSRYARRCGKPYIVAPRGMLYPQALAHNKIVKRMMMALYQSRELTQAACVQATCEEEMAHYRELGFTNPVAVIPNPIECRGVVDVPSQWDGVLRFGYLGRVHPRKRIERLIYAFDALRDKLKDAELLIIGGGDEDYERFLRGETERLGLKNVRFAGFLTGREKDEAIRSLSWLVVPSDFENFGNIVTEALVRGVPVIASKGMPWEELERCHCGRWIENDQGTINRTINEVCGLTEKERSAMGENGKRLVVEGYSVEALGEKMCKLYKWILGEGEKPEFVYTD